jgi:uroporphyrinogen decarboxylase
MRLFEKLDADVFISDPYPPAESIKRFPDGSYRDDWGVVHKPIPSPGFGTRIVDSPIKSIEDFERYEPPDPHMLIFDQLDRDIEQYGGEYAIMSGIGFTLFERAWTLRGFRRILMDFYRNPSFTEKLLDMITDYVVEVAKLVVERPIDIYWIGDDYGDQRGLFMSPDVWRRFIKPRLRRIVEVPKSKGIHVFIHSDGNVSAIIEDLIEVGITILNPVQPLALDPAWVKDKFGDRLCLFGTIDIQKTLPFGTPQDVVDEVKLRMETCGQGGGLILAPSHSVTPETPVENVLALVEAIKKYGRYPIKYP